jgi:ribosomal protein S4
MELSLVSLLLRCKLAYTLDDAVDLIKEGFVFVNGFVCYDERYEISQYDRIQFGLSTALHLYHRELLSYIRESYRELVPYVYSRINIDYKKNKQRKNIKAHWPVQLI